MSTGYSILRVQETSRKAPELGSLWVNIKIVLPVWQWLVIICCQRAAKTLVFLIAPLISLHHWRSLRPSFLNPKFFQSRQSQ